MWCPFPLRAKIRECQRGSQPRYQQTNSKQTYQIEIKCTHEPKRRQALAGQVIVCGTQRPSIKSPPYSQETNGKKTRWKNKMLTCPHRSYRLKSFYASSFIFGLLTFRQSRRCRVCAATSPRPTSLPAPLIKYSQTHILNKYIP